MAKGAAAAQVCCCGAAGCGAAPAEPLPCTHPVMLVGADSRPPFPRMLGSTRPCRCRWRSPLCRMVFDSTARQTALQDTHTALQDTPAAPARPGPAWQSQHQHTPRPRAAAGSSAVTVEPDHTGDDVFTTCTNPKLPVVTEPAGERVRLTTAGQSDTAGVITTPLGFNLQLISHLKSSFGWLVWFCFAFCFFNRNNLKQASFFFLLENCKY